MKNKKVIFIFIVSLVSSVSFQNCVKKQQDIQEEKYVQASGGLRMRKSPDSNSEVLNTIPDSSLVKVIETSGEQIEISGKKGKWTKISYQGKEGWVFGGFLKDKNELASTYSITFENQEKSMFSITFNSDNTFFGECYNGFSMSAKWEGKFKQIDTENFQINGVATSYYYGESEEIISSKFESIVTIKEKNGKTQIYNISINPIPGCDDISVEEGVLKNSAYGEYKYWDFL